MASGDRKMKIDGAPLQAYQEAPQLDKKKNIQSIFISIHLL